MLFATKKSDEVKKIEELNNPHKGPKYSKLASKKLVIQAKDIQKSYTNGYYVTNILKGVNLNIYEGEFVVILGPSGSGKTTLMNIMSGLDRATDGYMNVLGSNLINLNDDELTKFRRINIGYIFQQYGLIPNLKVKENIEVGLYLQKINKKESNKNKEREINAVNKEWQNELANGPSHTSLNTIIPEGNYTISDYIWLKCPLDNTSKKIIDMTVAPEKYTKAYIDAKYKEWIVDINERYDREINKSSHDTIEKIMKILNIEHLANKYPNELSGGQQQRVSIARSFAKNPKILFADEPTGAVDLEMSEIILNAFKDINKNFNTTIIVVTHNPDIAKLASKVVYFEDGHIKKIEQR